MPSCAIVTCKLRSESANLHTNGITFHRFPSNPETKEKWTTATGRGPVWRPGKRSTVCSVHFTDNQFRPRLNSRRLFDWAVPTLQLPVIPTP
ncbi:jg3142, partial [Pararge aegeria aegeria]